MLSWELKQRRRRQGRPLRPWQTRTHCCRHKCFPVCPRICCGHKFCVRDTKIVSDFVQKHFVSATNVSQFAQPKKHHGQQSVRNNVSSFTRAFYKKVILYFTSEIRDLRDLKGDWTQILIPLFHSPFSQKPLILWSPKMAASKLTTQTSFFSTDKLTYAPLPWERQEI